MAKKKIEQFRFAIASVTTEQFSVTSALFDPKQPIDLNISFEFKLSVTQQVIGTFLTVTYEQPQCKLVVLEVGCHFKMHPDTWTNLVDAKNDKMTLPHQRALHLGTITAGTARGVLHARLVGSPFAHVVLPPVNLTQVIGGDVVLNTSDNENSQ